MRKLTWALLWLLLTSPGVVAGTKEFEAGTTSRPPVIVTLQRSPLVTAAADRLASFLQAVLKQPIELRQEPNTAPYLIVLADYTVLSSYDVQRPAPNADEAFVIAPLIRGGQHILLIAGQTDHGVQQGIYQVMRTARYAKRAVLVPGNTYHSTPFIRLRGSHLGGYTRKVFGVDKDASGPVIAAPSEQLAWNHWENWDVERIGQYIDMLSFFGYNLLETMASISARLSGGSEQERQEARSRLEELVQHCRENGMLHQLQYNGTLFDKGDTIPYGPDTRDRYLDHYSKSAQAMAPYLDRVLTHWVDAGGWDNTPDHPCTAQMLQELHMQIDADFRKVNPGIKSILSLWFLDHRAYRKWVGYEGVDTILQGDRIPPEIGLAISRTYRPDEAKKIVAAGHEAGVWGWYLADHELVYTMHVHTHPLREYFGSLPREASQLLGFHTLSNCQSETNLYSIYVGARMMWDPYQDPDVYLREIARLIYGPRNEEAVFRALKAIADVRCGKRCRGYWNPEGSSKQEALDDGTPSFNGVRNFKQAFEQAQSAWKKLQRVQIDASYTPPLRFNRPVEVLLDELKGNVQAIATYMQVLKDRQRGREPRVEVPRAAGPFEYYERMQYLKPGEVYWPFTVVQ